MAPFAPDLISDQLNLVVALVLGVGFGFVLEQAGFSSSRRLAGLFYGYDFTVLRVFFTAALTAMASFIPMVGTALVWLPVSASKIMAGDITGGILFFVCSAALIWTLDNFIRPVLLHERLKIHPLLIFFAILGGLQVFKFNGLVLGPLILILFFTALELYEQAYQSPPEDQQRRKDDSGEDTTGGPAAL